jgi:hypothetical protein
MIPSFVPDEKGLAFAVIETTAIQSTCSSLTARQPSRGARLRFGFSVQCSSRRTASKTLKTNAFEKLSDVPKDAMPGIERFLVDYSAEEGNRIGLRGMCSRKEALALIRKGQKRFRRRGK